MDASSKGAPHIPTLRNTLPVGTWCQVPAEASSIAKYAVQLAWIAAPVQHQPARRCISGALSLLCLYAYGFEPWSPARRNHRRPCIDPAFDARAGKLFKGGKGPCGRRPSAMASWIVRLATRRGSPTRNAACARLLFPLLAVPALGTGNGRTSPPYHLIHEGQSIRRMEPQEGIAPVFAV
ncbi:hypothetical protein UVI_02054220 [Ustilaginoidea virens]|uniref:Uncharacterized protein n=1 Tax=Ustilaginoidea virens TaxID=1159556 RepID=A0A1B5KYK5_USTVR|nr:hypothetical protein UVI_02054220 [Ustilaginoidea virens]